MKTYEFTVILSDPDMDASTVHAIYGKCADSSIGGSHDTVYVAFDRESTSLHVAQHSAIDDLRHLGITPLRVEMDIPELAMAS
uniref:Uncharacterized protein n=1 Tax=Candidatus Kentrum eta TaxID=2126337 RepID=A0A450UP84_9GAMM|nr:MAG: hypothetical protein BECKH772A_GA0070896_100694 [Candidatus Kentron sp. H]VFJ94789.1 MAG: hypothetical protein BECKH772B_GA0070898_100674 [Candidatus Kentron sp. H]VFK01280.1 MAG: hypothetical protein BECKH772C_GA0070978_100624 [Candidatus Kentron sp. H]